MDKGPHADGTIEDIGFRVGLGSHHSRLRHECYPPRICGLGTLTMMLHVDETRLEHDAEMTWESHSRVHIRPSETDAPWVVQRERIGELAAENLESIGGNGGENCFTIGEVVVRGLVADAGSSRHLAHGESINAIASHNLGSSAEYLVSQGGWMLHGIILTPNLTMSRRW